MMGTLDWHSLLRLAHSGRRRQFLLFEAALSLAVASVALAILPFRKTANLSSKLGSARPPAPNPTALIVEVRSAVESAALRMPFRAKCFERGLAARMMLRRRGVATTLFYGAAVSDAKEVQAHVWVRTASEAVIGCENQGEFVLIAQFPPWEDSQNKQ